MTVMIMHRDQHQPSTSSRYDLEHRIQQSVNTGGTMITSRAGYEHLKSLTNSPTAQDYDRLSRVLSEYSPESPDDMVYLRPIYHNKQGEYKIHGWVALSADELDRTLSSIIMTGSVKPTLRLAQRRMSLFDAIDRDEIEVIWVRPFRRANAKETV